MNLHENKQLFADAILAASQAREDGGLGIKQVFLEKDYWITRSLKLLSEGRDAESAVFKGGTSISKAYGLGARFSEDIDIAITRDASRTDNQTKSLISRIAHSMSAGLVDPELSSPDRFNWRLFPLPIRTHTIAPQLGVCSGIICSKKSGKILFTLMVLRFLM